MATQTVKKGKAAKENVTKMVHVPLTPTQYEKLEEMTTADRRPRTEFMRILLDLEWDRRQKVAAGNGAAA